jgi:predicted nuclease of restriction endonuclease-like (RecB) superfamily
MLALFERAVLSPPKLSTALRELHPAAASHFKDAYLLEFLALPGEHSEADLHQSLLRNLGRFLTELGRDFCYIGSEYPVQVGGQDFAIDLLFFHRGLNCLVAIELKVDRLRARAPRQAQLLPRSAGPRRAQAAREPGHRIAAVRQQGQRGGGVRAEPHRSRRRWWRSTRPSCRTRQLLAAKLHEFYALNAPEPTSTRPRRPQAKKAGAK